MALWGGKQKDLWTIKKILKDISHNFNIFSYVLKMQIVTLDPELKDIKDNALENYSEFKRIRQKCISCRN